MKKYPMHVVTPTAAIFNDENKLLIIKRNAKEIAFPNRPVDFAWINEEEADKCDFVNLDQLISIFKTLKPNIKNK